MNSYIRTSLNWAKFRGISRRPMVRVNLRSMRQKLFINCIEGYYLKLFINCIEGWDLRNVLFKTSSASLKLDFITKLSNCQLSCLWGASPEETLYKLTITKWGVKFCLFHFIERATWSLPVGCLRPTGRGLDRTFAITIIIDSRRQQLFTLLNENCCNSKCTVSCDSLY